MNKKKKASPKKMAKNELHNFVLSGIGVLAVGLIFVLIDGVDWVDITLILIGVLMFVIRTKGMIIFVGLLEVLAGVFFIITFSYIQYTFWSGLLIILISIYLLWGGLKDIQIYYKIKENLVR